MSKLLELYEKRNKAVAAARAFLESKRADSDILSDEDNATYNKMEADILALGREIDRENRFAAIDAQMNAPTAVPITNAPQKPMEAKTGRASDEYKADMLRALRTNF